MSNTTLDDGDPSLTYSGTGWQTNAQQNSAATYYYNQTFHTTCQDQDYMEYSFTDTVFVYGAARTNKGYYSVTLDGGAKTYYNGYAPQDINQYLLWGMRSDGKQHQVRVYNEPTYQAIAGRNCLGIDDVVLEVVSSTSTSSASTTSDSSASTSKAATTSTSTTVSVTASALSTISDATALPASFAAPTSAGLTVTLAADSSGPHTAAVTGGDVVTIGSAGHTTSAASMSLVLLVVLLCSLTRV